MKVLRLPYSTATFSGNKSVHFIIALQYGVTKDLYRNLCSRLKKALPEADKSCFEPARLTRIPNTKIGQKLLHINARVSIEELEHWLTKQGYSREDEEIEVARKREVYSVNPQLTRMSKSFLLGEVCPEDAHRAILQTAKNLHELGHSYDEIVEILTEVRVTMRSEDYSYAKTKTTPIVRWVFKEWVTE